MSCMSALRRLFRRVCGSPANTTMMTTEEVPSLAPTDANVTLSKKDMKRIIKMYSEANSDSHVYVSRTAVQWYLKGLHRKSPWVKQPVGVPVVVWRPKNIKASLYIIDITSGLPLWTCELGRYTRCIFESDLMHTIRTENDNARLRFHNELSSATTYGVIDLMLLAISQKDRLRPMEENYQGE